MVIHKCDKCGADISWKDFEVRSESIHIELCKACVMPLLRSLKRQKLLPKTAEA